jgi:hypothetical protein
MTEKRRSARYVLHAQARRIHDLIGRRQDSRLLSERRALDELAQRGAFAQAQAVFEFGCGTGRFAAGPGPTARTFATSDGGAWGLLNPLLGSSVAHPRGRCDGHESLAAVRPVEPHAPGGR